MFYFKTCPRSVLCKLTTRKKKAALLRAFKDFLKCFLLIRAGVSAKFLKLVEFTRIQREPIYTSLLVRKVMI